MKKGYFFGLVLISLLLISGCQQAVGGAYGRQAYSTTDTTNYNSVNLERGNRIEGVNIYANPGYCYVSTDRGEGVNVKPGTPLIYNKNCYQVLSCGGFKIDSAYRSLSDVFVLATPQQGMFCAQQSQGVTVDLDKNGQVPLNLVFTRMNF